MRSPGLVNNQVEYTGPACLQPGWRASAELRDGAGQSSRDRRGERLASARKRDAFELLPARIVDGARGNSQAQRSGAHVKGAGVFGERSRGFERLRQLAEVSGPEERPSTAVG